MRWLLMYAKVVEKGKDGATMATIGTDERALWSLSPLSQPWLPDSQYAYGGGTRDYHLRARRDVLARLLRTPPPNATTANASEAWRDVFVRLARHGVRAGPLGLELTPGRGSFPPRHAAARAALHAALGLLVYAPSNANANWARLMWNADAPALVWPPPAARAARVSTRDERTRAVGERLLRQLLDDGFVRMDDLGLNATALHAQAMHALATDGVKSYRGDLLTARTRLPALEPLLSNESLAIAIRGYLGGSARFDGYATFKLTEKATTDTYPSGWCVARSPARSDISSRSSTSSSTSSGGGGGSNSRNSRNKQRPRHSRCVPSSAYSPMHASL
jgi:hypothetical protein